MPVDWVHMVAPDGQAAALNYELPANELVEKLAHEAQELLSPG
jgi:hypothetical protein